MNAKSWKKASSFIAFVMLLGLGCKEKGSSIKDDGNAENASSESASLPYFGEPDIQLTRLANGSQVADTIQYTIPKFSFINQDNKEISHRDYQNKIFVTDFFFTECPTICPVMSAQMARLQNLIKKENMEKDIMFLSFSVKPEHDTPEILKTYGEGIAADFTTWNFLTGKSSDIYELAESGFMLSAFPSDTAEGGIFHTDKISLIDRQMHIRGYYDGTSTKSVDQLFSDIKKLVKE